ncbi:MAG: PIN domain-containing protein [Acidimicrobiales bacterium]
MGLVVDTGALIAFDRGDRRVAALIEAARRQRDRVVTSSGCVAQAWRGGGAHQALLARLLRGTAEVGLDGRISRSIGGLCAATNTTDVVDSHLALLVRDGDVVLTSDVDDLRRLLRARGVRAEISRC